MFGIILITALIAVFISNAIAFEMKLNTLYLTARVDGMTAIDTVGADQNSVVPMMMDSYGLNYDTVLLPTSSLTLEKDNVALYNTIVVEGATLQQLNQVKAQITAYQTKYKIRVVYLNCEPDPLQGFKQNGFNPIQTIAMRNVKLTEEALQLAHQYQMKGDDVNFRVETCILRDITDVNTCIRYHHYEVALENPSDPNIKPLLSFLDFEYNQEIGAYGGALINNNGLEEMHFWISFVDSHIAFFVSHIWIPWANYGMIDGYRRLFFEIQIDDYFTDNCFNKADCEGKREPAGVPHYRTSVEDMKNIAQWHKDVSSRLPKGSNIKIELAINGIHILTETQHKIQGVFQNWTVPETGYDYVKPLGFQGTSRWPEDIDDDWDDSLLQQLDPLYAFFKKPENQDNFYWLTHTFTHLKLDAASYHDSDMEMRANIKMSKEPYLGMYDRECYSKHSIVTPEISGLHNGDNLKAFSENGVYYAVGDTSRTDLSPGNFYFPFISNQTTSNFDGFVVFPRQPPQVYWDCSRIEENMETYRLRYPDRTSVTWEKHLDEEAELHIKNFLKLRHDPYMFHEGNLRNADFQEVTIGKATGKFGMMQQWVERMVVEVGKYLDWPMISVKMDDLAASYIDRISRASCQPQYTMVIDDDSGIIKEVKVESQAEVKLNIVGDYKAQCRAPLFVMRNVEFNEKHDIQNVEKIGDEPPTAWIILDKAGESKSFKFSKEIKYNDEKFVGKSSGTFFSGFKLYLIIFVGIVILLLAAYFVYGKITGNKSESNSMYHNNQNNSQYYQSNIPQQFSNGYTQTLRINNDVRATEIGLRPNNNYQDNQKQKDYKNYKQLIS